jgi:hypothetical protein
VYRPPWAPDEVDITAPSVANNFESDRAFGQTVLAAYPALTTVLRENRAFLRRAVRYVAAAGVVQFLDLGSGIPTVGNVHEVARAADPAARIVYVDHDPVAVTHSRELLGSTPGTHVVAGDILDPERVLAEAVDRGELDLRRPVAVLAVAVLHFVPPERRPAEVMAQYLEAVVPGSHLVISHSADGPPAAAAGQRLYGRERSLERMWPRSTAEIAALFGDLTLVAPGIVAAPLWRPDPGEVGPVPDDYPLLAAVGRRG